MTLSDQPRKRSAWRFPFAGALAAAAVVGGGYALHLTVEIAGAFREGAAAVSAHPRDAVLAPLSVAMSCFAAMGLLPDSEVELRPSRRSARARRSDRIATWLFGCALSATLATPLASLAAAIALDRIAMARNYHACPAPSPNRFGLRQWAKTPRACRTDLR
jgi:hypothetical protein